MKGIDSIMLPKEKTRGNGAPKPMRQSDQALSVSMSLPMSATEVKLLPSH
ncbi:MAG TPA: hypothetical protein VKT12_05275 [Candidatus Binataceae bacterium]|nr:hypothetical protein [Candidatus Binataceae bacterium]